MFLESNIGFINKNCECCGMPDLVMSELHLVCNYGSINDGEEIRLALCGCCADEVYKFIQRLSTIN